MTKYEDLIKKRKNKDTSVDEIAKKYKMGVMDVKIMQEWKEKYEKEHKLRQEAENEMVLIKGITITNSPELRAANNEINDLKNKIAALEETVRSKDYWKELYEKEHKLRQEAENEMVLIKGITVTNSPELRAANNEINDLKNKIADLENTLESKDYFEKPDYKFLVEENLDLRRRITELEQEVLETKADNIKLARQIEDRIDQLRKAGM